MERVPGPPHFTLDRAVRRYVKDKRQLYLDMAAAIEPDRSDWRQVWDRTAFAILSANAPFESAKGAMEVMALLRDDRIEPHVRQGIRIAYRGIRVQQLSWVEALPAPYSEHHSWVEFTRAGTATDTPETWDAYRLRLQRSFKGLGLAKASFAAALIYPLDADIACIDVHMHRLFTGVQAAPHRIPYKIYKAIESAVRDIGASVGLPTFVAQWAIWDWARGKVEDHKIWPVYLKG